LQITPGAFANLHPEGVQKAQISRLENNASNVTMDTLLKVFTALKAKVKLQVELSNLNLSVGQ